MKQGLYIINGNLIFIPGQKCKEWITGTDLSTKKKVSIPSTLILFGKPVFEGNYHQCLKAHPELAV